MNQSTGTSEKYLFEGPAKFEGIDEKSGIKGEIEIMRIDEGFHVFVKNFSVKVGLYCEKCLEPMETIIKIKQMEKEYLLEKPERVGDPNDLYLVETKHRTIDLTEALRQEIILHFPVVQVCSQLCKGICQKCGADLNKEKCECTGGEDEQTGNHPLAELKTLIK